MKNKIMMNMLKMKKRGISLIVLVITIIVMIIIAGAIILSLSNGNVISKAKESKAKTELSYLKESWNNAYASALANNNGVAPTANEIQAQIGTIPAGYAVTVTGLTYSGADANIIAYATDFGVTVISASQFIVAEGVNKPKLATGMIAKKWDGSSWITISNPDTDTTWYDYTNKEWANAQTADGSMWVWLPRYEYKIPITHSSSAQTILINFLQDLSTTATATYSVHPAFTFGTTELTGIWVAKYEASGTISAVEIKSNETSLRTLTPDGMFTACRNMETTYGTLYGWGTTGTGIDTHLMKNIEWGSVAYLSASAYGKNTVEVSINSNSSYLTGQTGVESSTTGNVYGVYDMNGGAYERTAAYINTLNVSYTDLTIYNADAKYKDTYISPSEYSANSSKKGDAIYETSTTGTGTTSWNLDYSMMSDTNNPFFIRGGYYSNGTAAGLFAFKSDNGTAFSNVGFRPALLVADTL